MRGGDGPDTGLVEQVGGDGFDEPADARLEVGGLGGEVWVPKTVMLLCLSTRELGEVLLVAFGEVAVVVEAPFEC